MIKHILKAVVFGYFIATSVDIAADVPHVVPAPGCPAGQICCPVQIVCDYLNGCGDNYWSYAGYIAPYTGLKTFNLTSVNATTTDRINFSVVCAYDAINLQSHPNLGLIGDGWQYKFDKMGASCLSNNSTQCSAKQQ